MRNHGSVEFLGKEVTVKEMTVLELDEQLGGERDENPSMLDRLLAQHMLTSQLLSDSCGVPVADLEKAAPSRLTPLIKKFQELNPDFFEMARFEMNRAAEMTEVLGKILDPASIL